MNKEVTAKSSDEYFTGKSTKTPPNSRHDIGNRFCTTQEKRSTGNPRKNTEELNIDAEE